MSNKPSLQEQLKKRKQEEIRRTITAKQIERTKGPAEPAQPTRTTQSAPAAARTATVRSVQPLAPKSTSQTAPAVTPSKRAPFQGLSTRQKTTMIAAGAALMMLVVCIGTFLIASSAANTTTPGATATYVPVGASSADALLQRFTSLGIVVDDQKPYDLADSKVWTATQGYTFNVNRNNAQASFLVLSYATSADANNNIFSIMGSDKYKTWATNIAGNVILLAAPGSKSDIVHDMFSHMTTYLYAPYRVWPTATPLATATSAATATPKK